VAVAAMLAMSDIDIDIVLNAVRVKGLPLSYGRRADWFGKYDFSRTASDDAGR